MAETIAPLVCCAPLSAPVLSESEALATAELFRALGDPARVRIVNLLATTESPGCVCDLIETLGLSQLTVSHHLNRLVDAGILERELRGKWAYFSLDPDAAARLTSLVALEGGSS